MSILASEHLQPANAEEIQGRKVRAYEVQTLMLDTWENCWSVINDDDTQTPETFATFDQAREAIKDCIIDQINAVEAGDMIDHATADDFRIIALF